MSLWIQIYIYSYRLLKTFMRTHLPEKVRGTDLRDIKSVGGHVPRMIYAPGL